MVRIQKTVMIRSVSKFVTNKKLQREATAILSREHFVIDFVEKSFLEPAKHKIIVAIAKVLSD